MGGKRTDSLEIIRIGILAAALIVRGDANSPTARLRGWQTLADGVRDSTDALSRRRALPMVKGGSGVDWQLCLIPVE